MHNADYQSAFDAGRKRAASWYAQHGYTLAVFRDLERAAYASGLIEPPAGGIAPVCQGFDAGFAAGLADLLCGVRHE